MSDAARWRREGDWQYPDAPALPVPHPRSGLAAEPGPVLEPPVALAPVVQPPVAQPPVAQAPVVQAPVAEVPVAEPPVVQAPAAPARPAVHVPPARVAPVSVRVPDVRAPRRRGSSVLIVAGAALALTGSAVALQLPGTARLAQVQAAITGTTPAAAEQEVAAAPAPFVPPAEVLRPVTRSRSAQLDDAVSPPVSLRVPALGIDTKLLGLRKDRSGELQVPEDPQRAGWYSQGPAPGAHGSAVVVGHVDSYEGPGIFVGLSGLPKGAEIDVRRSDGTTATFVVQSVDSYSKTDFPTQQVYRGDGAPSLRLITCGGTFDRKAKSYQENVVVLATPKNAAAASASDSARRAG